MNKTIPQNSNVYPEHEFSKYIDPQLSFSNSVKYLNTDTGYYRPEYPTKFSLVDALKNARCQGGIMLEPRLQEYIKKKKYFKDNNIKPCVSLESEFQITNLDRRVLRAFFAGARDMYKPHHLAFSENNKKGQKSRQYFPSSSFKKDDRVPEITKPEMNKPVNRGMFVPDSDYDAYYEDRPQQIDGIMDGRDLQSNANIDLNLYKNITGFNLADSKFNPRTDPEMDPGIEKYNKYRSQYRIDPSSSKNCKPRNDFDKKYQTGDPRNKYILSDLSKKKKKHLHGSNKASMTLDNYSSFEDDNNVHGGLDNSNESTKYLESFAKHGHGHGLESDTGFSEFAGYDDSTASRTYSILKPDKYNSRNDRNGRNGRNNRDGSNDSRYGKMDSPGFSEKSDMDFDAKMNIPKLCSRDRRDLSTYNYRMGMFTGQDQPIMKDADFETSLIRGMPSHTMKSYGYRNPEEHYFQYIDDDFQNPDNSVEPYPRGGDSTRRDNKAMAKQKYTRDVL